MKENRIGYAICCMTAVLIFLTAGNLFFRWQEWSNKKENENFYYEAFLVQYKIRYYNSGDTYYSNLTFDNIESIQKDMERDGYKKGDILRIEVKAMNLAQSMKLDRLKQMK